MTEKRLELLEWFRRNAPSLGELYEGAVILLFGESLIPGRSRFITHAVREIRNRLPDAVGGSRSTRLDYVNKLDQIARLWQEEGLLTNGPFPIENDSDGFDPSIKIPVPRRVYEKVSILVKDHLNARERPEDIARRLFIGIAPENEQFIDQLRPTVLRWLEICDWFMKFVHDSGKTDTDILTDEFVNNFKSFEDMMYSLLGSFFATTEELDAILAKANK